MGHRVDGRDGRAIHQLDQAGFDAVTNREHRIDGLCRGGEVGDDGRCCRWRSLSLMVASTMTASVPSDPTSNWVRFKPATFFRVAAPCG